jgi:hypothetical protein
VSEAAYYGVLALGGLMIAALLVVAAAPNLWLRSARLRLSLRPFTVSGRSSSARRRGRS